MEKTTEVKGKGAKEPMTPKQRTIFILKIVGNVIFYAVILLLFLFSLMNINSGGKGGIPNLFGKGYLSVQSTSMSIEQDVYSNNELPEKYKDYAIKSFNKGDLIHVQMVNENEVKKLKIGDVVTFWSDKLNAYNTHRIVYMTVDENGNATSISTQGDNSVINKGVIFDPTDSANSQTMLILEQSGDIDTFSESSFNKIKAVTTGVSSGMGSFMDNIHNYWLFIFVIPIAIILLIEVILVVKNILDLRREKNKAIDLADHEAQMAELQNEKERMRQELLAELRAQGAIQAEPEAPKASEEVKEETPVVAAVVEEKATPEVTEEPTQEVEEMVEEPVEATEPEQETKTEEAQEEASQEKEEKKEEPVVNEEKVEEPDLSIEENDDEDGSK